MDTTDGTSAAPRHNWRVLARVAVVLGLLVGGALWSAGAASAAPFSPDVTAQAGCKGKVDFTTVSRGTPANRDVARTVNSLKVAYSVDQGKTWTALPAKPSWKFNKANGFQFTDSFQLPEPLPKTVVVAVQAAENWGNGNEPGPPGKSAVVELTACAAAPAPRETAQPGPPVQPPRDAVAAAPVAATGSRSTAVVIVAVLIGVALVIDVIGVMMFIRRRRLRVATAA
jgi:hypothetical protein